MAIKGAIVISFLWQVFIYHGQTLRLWNRDFQAILSIKTKSKNKLNSIRRQFKLRLMMQGRAVSKIKGFYNYKKVYLIPFTPSKEPLFEYVAGRI